MQSNVNVSLDNLNWNLLCLDFKSILRVFTPLLKWGLKNVDGRTPAVLKFEIETKKSKLIVMFIRYHEKMVYPFY